MPLTKGDKEWLSEAINELDVHDLIEERATAVAESINMPQTHIAKQIDDYARRVGEWKETQELWRRSDNTKYDNLVSLLTDKPKPKRKWHPDTMEGWLQLSLGLIIVACLWLLLLVVVIATVGLIGEAL